MSQPALYDLGDDGLRLTLAEVFARLEIDWTSPSAHVIAALGVGDMIDVPWRGEPGPDVRRVR